jgi:hypothetical protein
MLSQIINKLKEMFEGKRITVIHFGRYPSGKRFRDSFTATCLNVYGPLFNSLALSTAYDHYGLHLGDLPSADPFAFGPGLQFIPLYSGKDWVRGPYLNGCRGTVYIKIAE